MSWRLRDSFIFLSLACKIFGVEYHTVRTVCTVRSTNVVPACVRVQRFGDASLGVEQKSLNELSLC
jgi:hypothetical protein